MGTAIFLSILLIVVVSSVFHDDLPTPFRARDCMGREWKRAFPSTPKEDIRRFLTIFTEAFAFHERNRLKFSPHDRLHDIYRALYPSKWMPDQLEHVHLVRGLEDEFKREFPESLMAEDVTLGMIFNHMTGNANNTLEAIRR